jgi:uncharacterized repeat protein (TIGR03803 family)
VAGLVFGKNGELFGTAEYGGSATSGSPCNFYGAPGCGTVFELTPPGTPGLPWTETVLHSFSGRKGDGGVPLAFLTLSRDGVLYGTTSSGGDSNLGTVFAVKP